MTVPRLVDVGGYRLAIAVTGSGEPPVVFVSALGTPASRWRPVLEQVTTPTILVTYDRPGLGESDPLPEPLASSDHVYVDAAGELRRLLAAAAVDAPRVLVGHSIGALIILTYAAHWPDETAGLVLSDATDPDQWLELYDGRYRVDSDHGGWRWDFEPSRVEQASLVMPTVPAVVVTSAVGRWLEAAEQYPTWPVAELDAHWQARQRKYAEDLGAVQVIADEAGHNIPKEAPGLVAVAVDAVVAAARNGGPVTVDPAQLHEAGGYLA